VCPTGPPLEIWDVVIALLIIIASLWEQDIYPRVTFLPPPITSTARSQGDSTLVQYISHFLQVTSCMGGPYSKLDAVPLIEAYGVGGM